jgi:Xaa-Pro dipeptidase
MNESSSKLDKVLAAIKQKGFDGVLAYSNGTCSMLRPTYFYYMAELRPMGPQNALVISKAGDAVLLVTPRWDENRVRRSTWVKDVRGTSDFLKDLVEVMREFGMTGTIGVVAAGEMVEKTYLTVNALAKMEPADDIIEEIASEKTDKDLENVRKTAAIADIGFNTFLEYARVGIKEYELSAEMEYKMRKAGADDNFTLLSSSKHSYAMHTPTDKRLEAGDLVLGEITPLLNGQFIQLCRTIVLGQPSPLIREKYDMLVHALNRALEPIKPGVPAGQISINMNKVISDAGYKEYCYPPYMRARGHGMSVGSIAPGGTIDDSTKNLLAKNQVIIVHPNQYIPETGYLACGQSILVTDTGFERLAKTETKLYIKEG